MAETKEYAGVTISVAVMNKIREIMKAESRSKSNAVEVVLERGLSK